VSIIEAMPHEAVHRASRVGS